MYILITVTTHFFSFCRFNFFIRAVKLCNHSYKYIKSTTFTFESNGTYQCL